MPAIDYTKVTADGILKDCMKCKGKESFSVLLFINESGKVIAYDNQGCFMCESN